VDVGKERIALGVELARFAHSVEGPVGRDERLAGQFVVDDPREPQ
jgi:hypothetical protein